VKRTAWRCQVVRHHVSRPGEAAESAAAGCYRAVSAPLLARLVVLGVWMCVCAAWKKREMAKGAKSEPSR
jgi:hypothetical protein